MASIQKIIAERIRIFIHNEIKKYFQLQNAESRKMKDELAECKKRLSKLEKEAEIECKKTIERWFEQIRANGTILKTLQKKLGVSQTELAILLGTNPATVNRWESGKVRLSRKSCEKVAKIRSLTRSEAQQLLKKECFRSIE